VRHAGQSVMKNCGMKLLVSILGWAGFSMTVTASAADAGVRGWEGLQRPAQVQTAMQKDEAVPAGRPADQNTRDADAGGVLVGDIRFLTEKSGAEKVCFVLKPFCSPEVFSLVGTNPRIVVDILNVHSWKGRSRIPVEGALIRQVRTHFYPDQHRLRIVLDLRPFMNYRAEPLYYRADGIYCMAVAVK